VRRLRRLIFWLLVLELVAVFAAAMAIRIKLEQPVRYIGSALPAHPQQVGETGTPVLDASQHEEEIA
jgi:hypothetical protein